MLNKKCYTKQEVADLINKIIHQDSFGDILFYGGKIMREHNMKMIDPRNKNSKDFDEGI